jgi:hypothetical protein
MIHQVELVPVLGFVDLVVSEHAVKDEGILRLSPAPRNQYDQRDQVPRGSQPPALFPLLRTPLPFLDSRQHLLLLDRRRRVR